MNRTAFIERRTAETDISLSLNVDGTGVCNVDCPVGFFTHMLHSFCKHGLFDLSGTLKGDLEVDQHHLLEDTGIVLGSAFAQALGNCAGIFRTGFCLYPMDETLGRAAVDFGGRSYLVCEANLTGTPLVSRAPDGKETLFQTDCFEDFWQSVLCTLIRCAAEATIIKWKRCLKPLRARSAKPLPRTADAETRFLQQRALSYNESFNSACSFGFRFR